MAKYTKYLEFSTKERVAIKERDNYQCIFCQIGYKMPPAAVLEMDITDGMDGATVEVRAYGDNDTFSCWSETTTITRFGY